MPKKEHEPKEKAAPTKQSRNQTRGGKKRYVDGHWKPDHQGRK